MFGMSRDVHMVPHFDSPDKWSKGVGLDPGMTNPTAWVHGARFGNGKHQGIYLYAGHQQSGKLVVDHAARLLSEVTPMHQQFWIDHDATKSSHLTGGSVLETYRLHGLPFQWAPRDWQARINRVREYMRFNPELVHPVTGKKGCPGLLMSDRLMECFDALQQYRKEEQKTNRGSSNVPERARKYNDHYPDAVGYLVVGMMPPLTPGSEIAGQVFHEDMRIGSPVGFRAPALSCVDESGNYSLAQQIEASHQVSTEMYEPTSWLLA